MEPRGAINEYWPYKGEGPTICTINLANGTTPFFTSFAARQHQSRNYVLTRQPKVTITHGWYRPCRAEFDAMHPSVQDHVLNGGLLKDVLAVAIDKQLPNDPVETTWTPDVIQEWCQEVYGRSLNRK